MTIDKTKPSVLVLGPENFGMLEAISAFTNPIAFWEYDTLQSCRVAAGEDFRGLVSTGEKQVTEQFMSELPALEVITCFGVGYDGIDVPAATRRHIPVTNTPDVLTEDVADLAIGMIIAARRNMMTADRYIRDGRWETQGPMPLASRVNGKKVGIAGLGRIGGAIAKRLEAFNCVVSYSNKNQRPDQTYRFYSSLVQLAAENDILVITMPGGPATDKAINREVIQAIGAQGTLVNISRGTVVDEEALITALQNGELGSAALDVFRHEPFVPQALKEMPNVILQPHTASATWDTRIAMRDLVVENLHRFFQGKSLKTPV